MGGVGLSETPLGVLQLWRGFGSGRSKLRFHRNSGFQACLKRVLQLRGDAIGGAALVLGCSLEQQLCIPAGGVMGGTLKSSSAHLLSGVFGWVRFDLPGVVSACWEKPRLELLQPQAVVEQRR